MNNIFQILSLDGGGIKGIFSSAILAFLEEDLNINIIDNFDLITGTSTGGLIALALGTGMKPKDILDFYINNGNIIFKNNLYRTVRRFFYSKHDSSVLEDCAKECFQNKLLGDSKKRLVIPSYNLGEDDIYLFKTSHHDRLRRDYKVPLWKIALATSAAPTYFSSFKGVDDVRLIDGGVWANNPTMVGIIEANSMLDVPLNSIKVLSIGTTDEVKGYSKDLDNGGLWKWKNAAINVIMQGQSIGVHTQSIHILGKNKVYRLNPKVPSGLFSLDKLSKDELYSKAAHTSRHFLPIYQKEFFTHKAEEFIPCHKL